MLKCSFCSQGESTNKELDFNSAIKILKKLKKAGVLRIFYTGGEPFVYKRFGELLEYGKKLGFCQLVISNGYALDLPNNKKILTYIDGISISVHGSLEKHNEITGNKKSYQKVVENLNMLKKDYPNILVDVCYTASEYNCNIEDITDIAKLCKKLNVTLNITRVYKIGKALDNDNFNYINELTNNITTLKKKGYDINIGHSLVACALSENNQKLCSECMAGINFCAIDVNGDVKICGNATQVIGNILKENFKKIIKRMFKIQNKHIDNLPLVCKNCTHLNKCIGGCKSEIGKIQDGLNDKLAKTIISSEWDEIKNKKFKPQIAAIRKINYNKYLLIGKKNVFISKYLYNLLNNIDFDTTIKENYEKSNNKEIFIELILLLYKDELIQVK